MDSNGNAHHDQPPPSEPNPIPRTVKFPTHTKINVPPPSNPEKIDVAHVCPTHIGKRNGILNKIFPTRTFTQKKDRKAYIRTTVIELLIYILFLANLCIEMQLKCGIRYSIIHYYALRLRGFNTCHLECLPPKHTTTLMTKVISDHFLDAPFDGINFKTSTNLNHFWSYAEKAMIKALYWEKWYEVKDVQAQDQGVLYENRLMGLPRLRQIRVKRGTCPAAENFRRLVRVCYSPYTSSLEDTGIFAQFKYDHPTAWKYHSPEELKGSSHWGLLHRYSGGGSFVLLGSKADEAAKIIDDLKQSLWINRATRAIFLDFTVYNANINLFCIMKLVWEFPATGGMLTSWSVRTVRLIRYVTSFDYFVFICEIIFIIFTIYYLIQEILEFIQLGWKEYFADIWSWLDLTILTISLVCIAFSIARSVIINNTLGKLLEDPNDFADFEFLGFWESQFNNGVAICIFFCWIKVFKYISFNKTMNQLSSTLSRCSKDIGGFAIMFFIVFFAFAQMGYLLFGSQAGGFRSLDKAIFTLLRLILGDFQYREIETANRILGPIFFLTYVFFVFFVLLNMFLAIINETYGAVKAEIQSQRNEFEIADYIKHGFNNLLGKFHKRNKRIDIENTVKLAAADGHITYDELRNNLTCANFSEVEVEMFLARYELDQDRTLDEDEMQQVLADLEGQRISLDKKDKGQGKRLSLIPQHTDPIKDLALTQEELADMQRRVGTMETTLSSVTHKLDGIIRKLDTFDRRIQ